MRGDAVALQFTTAYASGKSALLNVPGQFDAPAVSNRPSCRRNYWLLDEAIRTTKQNQREAVAAALCSIQLLYSPLVLNFHALEL